MGSDKKKAYGAVRLDDNLMRLWPEDVVLIGRDTKDSADTHPLFDERVRWKPDPDLIQSMLTNGWDVERPATVRKNGQTADGKPIVEVVTGRRRTVAARAANEILKARGSTDLITMVAIARHGENVDLVGAMGRENAMRADDNPALVARKMARWMRFGKSVEECAVNFGMTAPTVRRHLDLLDGDPALIDAVGSMKIPMEAAKKLLALPHAEQREQVKKILAAKGIGATAVAMNMMADEARGPKRGRVRASRGKVAGRRQVEAFEKKLTEQIGDKPPSKEQKLALAVLQWFQGDVDALAEYEWARQALAPGKRGRKPKAKPAVAKAAE